MSKLTFGTVPENFYRWEKETPQNIYLRQPVKGEWIDFTWQQTADEVRRMVTYLHSLNLPPQSHIGLVSKNCAHWILADIAIAVAGHISVPFYATLVADQINQVLVHSECKVLFIGKLDDWKSMKAGIPDSLHCIAFPAYYEGCPATEYITWTDIIAKNEPYTGNPSPNLDDIATIIYTSGTTGVPKGVMLTHRAGVDGLTQTGENAMLNIANPTFFSYLPLSHIAERNVVESASLATGGTVYFAESLETFAKNLAFAQPSHFLAVPRIWTKFQMGILSKMPQKKLNLFLKIPIFSGMVKKKIKTGLGLANAKLILTGAAPMPASLIEWFKKLDIHIQEAYGMSENLGACTMMPRNAVKNGTVGKPYNGVEVRIDPDTSELQMKASWNTIGYYKEPILTKELYTEDGWLKTGDMAALDSEGYLAITGRVKDIFKTSKGEYVAPSPIEDGFAMNPYIEQICVTGSILPQPIALIVLSDLAKGAEKEVVHQSLKASVKEVNPNFKNYEHIKKVVIMPEPWTVDNNMMTPTLKIKRNIIEKNYTPHMEAWYEQEDMVVYA